MKTTNDQAPTPAVRALIRDLLARLRETDGLTVRELRRVARTRGVKTFGRMSQIRLKVAVAAA